MKWINSDKLGGRPWRPAGPSRWWVGLRTWQLILLGLAGLGAAGTLVVVLLALLLLPTLPSITNIAEDRLKVPMRVYSAEGRLLGEFGEERRIPVTVEEIPQPLIDAILAAEDDSFYSHWGVDFRGIARAVLRNLQSGRRGQGASTITMQVARNFFLSPERTYTRKFKEVLLAFKIESVLSKDKILELYINKIFLGQRAYGFAAAAQIYYGKSVSELALSEMAMLAGLPKAPSRNNPISNPENAIERRNYVLQRMAKLEYIGEETLKEALNVPVSASKHRFEYDVNAPYVAEMVRRYMFETYAEKTYAGGFHVYTTIQADHQHAANQALHNGLLSYEDRHGYRGPVDHTNLPKAPNKEVLDELLKDHRAVGGLVPAIVLLLGEKNAVTYTQDGYITGIDWDGLSWAKRFRDRNNVGQAPEKTSDILRIGDIVYLGKMGEGKWRLAQVPEIAGAFISMRPSDGAILALTGGFDFQQSHFNRVTQAERQPGSNIKPFIYSAALEKGYTTASQISGAPIVIEDKNLEDVWRPENYSGKFFGPTRLRTALTKSLNLVSVRLLRAIGPKYAVSYLERFGFDREKLPANLSLALGSASFTPLDMASAFAVFANGGFQVEPYFITRVEDGEGNLLEQANPTRVCPDCPETVVLYKSLVEQEEEISVSVKETSPPEKTEVAVTSVELLETGNAEQLQETDAAEGEKKQIIEPRFAPRVVRPENAFIMTTIMRDVIKYGTGRRAMALQRDDLAGKTGTTNEFRDAWFSGFNSEVVATAWMGFDQPATLGRHESGARAALPVWIDYMRVVLQGTQEQLLEQPEGVVAVMIDPETGAYVGPVSEETEEEMNKPDEAEEIISDEEPVDEEDPGKPAKLPPIKEYFIAGSEPRSEPTSGDETPPPPAGTDPQEGLF